MYPFFSLYNLEHVESSNYPPYTTKRIQSIKLLGKMKLTQKVVERKMKIGLWAQLGRYISFHFTLFRLLSVMMLYVVTTYNKVVKERIFWQSF